MATPCYTQLTFRFQRKVVVDFAGGDLTGDAGLVLVRAFDERMGFTEAIARGVEDPRDPRYVTHDLAQLLRQRIYQIAAGYEDVNDATALRTDPAFQIVAGGGTTAPLGSQPTLSRLEHALDWGAIERLAGLGLTWFCRHAVAAGTQPAEIVLDVDATDDPAHGAQQLALFRGHYAQVMYFPLCWFEGQTGLPLRTRLRPGDAAPAAGVVEDLERLLPPLRRRFPDTPVRLRGDAGVATPRVEAALEAAGIDYVLGLGPNCVFTRWLAVRRAQAEARYARTRCPVALRTSFHHRAARWPRQRRILVKLDVTATGTTVRYFVTNRRGRAADLIRWYEQRGASENWIKELKRDLHADRLSCHRYRANAARLQLHTLAYLLLAYFRRQALRGTELATATTGTLRLRLLKIGARVVRSVRRLWVHLASGWPGRELFTVLHHTLARAPS
jgi:Transposase DDE domain group 1